MMNFLSSTILLSVLLATGAGEVKLMDRELRKTGGSSSGGSSSGGSGSKPSTSFGSSTSSRGPSYTPSSPGRIFSGGGNPLFVGGLWRPYPVYSRPYSASSRSGTQCIDDGICNNDEDCVSCPTNCRTFDSPACGDGICTPGEDCVSCPEDCALAADGICCGTNATVCNHSACNAEPFTCIEYGCEVGDAFDSSSAEGNSMVIIPLTAAMAILVTVVVSL